MINPKEAPMGCKAVAKLFARLDGRSCKGCVFEYQEPGTSRSCCMLDLDAANDLAVVSCECNYRGDGHDVIFVEDFVEDKT